MAGYQKTSEDVLAVLSAAGDGRAFSELVGRCDARLRSLLSQYALGHEQDDVLQESYRKAFQSLSSFDASRASFVTWLSAIASRTALDHLRSRNVREILPLATDESGGQIQPQAMTNSPEEDLICAQSYRDVIDRIHSLPDAYRRVAELRLLDELPYEEIALKLSLPLNTVRTRIRRARILLSRR